MLSEFLCDVILDRYYDASKILVLSDGDVRAKWFWANAAYLATKYRKHNLWIERGLMACEQAGEPHDYFIGRYLEGDGRPMLEHVDVAMRDISIKASRGFRR